MKIIILALALISSSVCAKHHKKGDILLQPLHCWSCSLIEAQTKSIYSHIGVVIDDSQEVLVAEAFITVRKQTLKEFMAKTQKGQKIKVLRPTFVPESILETFVLKYEGLKYDSAFLWDNVKEGKELIYCSELVYKLFDDLNMPVPHIFPMKFDINREYWIKYFKGNVPDGKEGISPAAFDDESLYEFAGYL